MNVRKIPVPILLALGLGACRGGTTCLDVADATGPCLIAPTDSTTGPCLSPCLDPDVGPCLFDIGGPCLQPPSTTDTGSTDGTGTGSSGGTDTGSTGDTETGTGTDTGDATAHSEVLERLRDRGVLPADVAARLRRPPTEKA